MSSWRTLILFALAWSVEVHAGLAPAQYQVFWGDVHGHTRISDGKGTLDDYFKGTDRSFAGAGYYYVRVVQADKDEHGHFSQAWSSPIWVKKRRPAGK